MCGNLGWSVKFVIELKGVDMWVGIIVVVVTLVGTLLFDCFRVVDGPVRGFRESQRTKKARDIEVEYEEISSL